MEGASSTLGAIVSDTEPAGVPGTEAVVGRFVTLERMKESDIPSLWSAVGVHEDLWTHWPEGPYSQDEFTAAMQKFLADESLVVYTILQRDETVGFIVLLPVDLKGRVMEIGMVYGPKIQRTRGATEAVYLLASLTFDRFRNRRLQWKTDRLNTASRRAAERYGFIYEGCLRQRGIVKGRNRDEVWYSMLDGEWPVCKRAFEAWLDDANFDEQGSQRRSLVDVRQGLISKERLE